MIQILFGRPRFYGAFALLVVSAFAVGVRADDIFEGAQSPHKPATQPATTEPTTEPTTQPGGLTLTTWAPKGNLKNPTALSFDREGRCYVAQTMRRGLGEMEVRPDPLRRVLPDHTFRTVEDRFRFGGDGDPAWGLETGGAKEIITRFEDTTHCGKADKADVFYEGFDQNGNDILAGILWHEGNLYATLAPNLWLLHDTKNEGHPDVVKSLSFGYAVHMTFGGHNMHGPCVGPDGKIYFTIGDKGLNVTTAEGKHLDYSTSGSCIRCNPDGSDLEVFAYGIRNAFEIAFDKYGNLFAVDNDGDMPTERERLIYITEGSDSGWRFTWQYRAKRWDLGTPPEQRVDHYNPWMNEKMWVPFFPGQPAHITPGLANYTDGPCGFKYATEGSLNERLRGEFFVVEFPKATIRAFAVKPKGAYFTMTDDRIISRGVQCTGLTLGPDGALYGAEWGKTAFKMGNTGSVVKLDDPEAAESRLRKETHRLLAEGPYQKSAQELLQLLGHADMRVRLDAQFELVRRKSFEPLEQVAFEPGSKEMPRIHALWGLGQFVSGRTISATAAGELSTKLAALFVDRDPEIRAQAAKLAGQVARFYGPVVSSKPVIALLGDESLRVRFFAAMALGDCKDRGAIIPLLKLAAENHPIDAYIRHAIVMGLVGIGNAEALAACATHASPDVRIAAVVALRRLKDPSVARFLGDRDELVAAEAARAIHDDDSILQALPALAAAAGRTDITSEAFIRRALNANLRLGGREQIARLARYATTETNPPAMRVEAIDILANWEAPLLHDRVEGSYRAWPQRSGWGVKSMIAKELAGLLASEDHNVAQAATQLIDRLGIKTDDKVFVGWVQDARRPVASRVTALRLLASRKYVELHQSVETALESSEPLLRIEAVRVLSDLEPARSLELIAKTLDDGTIVEKQAAFHLLGELRNADANAQLGAWLDKLLAGEVPAEVRLDLIEAAGSTRNKELRKKLRAWEGSLDASDPLAIFTPALAGGDAERGKSVFTAHPEAACIRCHTTSTDGAGSTVGPNLAGIGAKPDKPRRYLLESMVNPNAYIVPGYGMTSIKLKNGGEISAILKAETDDAVQLLDLEGKATTIKKSDIASRTPAVSMMPAMGALLTRDEIRDVIEYLSSLKN